ncbi:MAG TPA: helix-hairpin-helix domain-containing protein [Polyangiaceae bacterium]|nr:helix-hairpin-helix domain-containing protein [Polyangiaceae bacterium]
MTHAGLGPVTAVIPASSGSSGAGSIAEALADASERAKSTESSLGTEKNPALATALGPEQKSSLYWLSPQGAATDATATPIPGSPVSLNKARDAAGTESPVAEAPVGVEAEAPVEVEMELEPENPPALPPPLFRRRSEPPSAAPHSAPVGSGVVSSSAEVSSSTVARFAASEVVAATDAVSPPNTLSDIDERFESIVSRPPAAPEPPSATADLSATAESSAAIAEPPMLPVVTDAAPTLSSNADLEDARRLFVELSGAYLGPLRDLMLEIELTDPSREWLAVCRPAVASLSQAAKELGMESLVRALEGMRSALDDAGRGLGSIIDLRGREALRTAYRSLVAELPGAFSVTQERDRREPLIVQSLLLQVPEVRKVALDRIYSAGLCALEHFYKAKPAEIAETAGIPRELAERIVARFQRYRRETGSMPPSARKGRERTQLENLARKLEEQNSAYDASSQSFGSGEDKRRLRQERAATLLEVNLLLARSGELRLIEKLERSTFQGKAEALRKYLSERAE